MEVLLQLVIFRQKKTKNKKQTKQAFQLRNKVRTYTKTHWIPRTEIQSACENTQTARGCVRDTEDAGGL